jgi:hypothetical protein
MIDNHQERSDKPNSIQSWEVYLFDHANFESPIYLNSFKLLAKLQACYFFPKSLNSDSGMDSEFAFD